MAESRRESLMRRMSDRLRGRGGAADLDVRRIEQRSRTASAATQQWLALLREMEDQGQTTDARYETYYQAYLQAKQQQKRADLELFNLRQSLTG